MIGRLTYKNTRLVGLAVSHFNKIEHCLRPAARLFPPEAIVLEGKGLNFYPLTQRADFPRPEYPLRYTSGQRTLEKWDNEEETTVRLEIEEIKIYQSADCLYDGFSLEANEAFKFARHEGVPVFYPEQFLDIVDSHKKYIDLGIPRILLDRLTIYPYGRRPKLSDKPSTLKTDGLDMWERNEQVGRFIAHLFAAEGYRNIMLIMGGRHFNASYGKFMDPSKPLFAAGRGENVQDFTGAETITIVDTEQPGFTAYTF